MKYYLLITYIHKRLYILQKIIKTQKIQLKLLKLPKKEKKFTKNCEFELNIKSTIYQSWIQVELTAIDSYDL